MARRNTRHWFERGKQHGTLGSLALKEAHQQPKKRGGIIPFPGKREQQQRFGSRAQLSKETQRFREGRKLDIAEIEREIRMREFSKREANELKRLADENLRGNRDRELADIYKVVLGGVEQGHIRGPADIELYFREWFRQLLEMDPGFAQHLGFDKFRSREEAISYHSQRAAKKFMDSFPRKYSRPGLYGIFNRLAQIARGEDPYD